MSNSCISDNAVAYSDAFGMVWQGEANPVCHPSPPKCLANLAENFRGGCQNECLVKVGAQSVEKKVLNLEFLSPPVGIAGCILTSPVDM